MVMVKKKEDDKNHLVKKIHQKSAFFAINL